MAKRQKTYNAMQAAKMLEIGRATLYRWLESGRIKEVARDFRGRRAFTDSDIKKIRDWMTRLTPPSKGRDREE